MLLTTLYQTGRRISGQLHMEPQSKLLAFERFDEMVSQLCLSQVVRQALIISLCSFTICYVYQIAQIIKE